LIINKKAPHEFLIISEKNINMLLSGVSKIISREVFYFYLPLSTINRIKLYELSKLYDLMHLQSGLHFWDYIVLGNKKSKSHFRTHTIPAIDELQLCISCTEKTH